MTNRTGCGIINIKESQHKVIVQKGSNLTMSFPFLFYGTRPEYRCLEILSGSRPSEEAYPSAVGQLLALGARYTFRGSLWKTAIAWLLLMDENTFSLACERQECSSETLNQTVLTDMDLFRRLFFRKLPDGLPEDCCFGSGTGTLRETIGQLAFRLAEDLDRTKTVKQFRDTVQAYYRDYGVGTFCTAPAFRIEEISGRPELQPVQKLSPVRFPDLWGYELQKKKLRDNTEAFLRGTKANNVLLYGDAGTGKSTCMKALLNEYFSKGLRMVEINKYQFRHLQTLAQMLRERNYFFVFYLDDLSFEETELEYKYLKAVIEGGIEPSPDNILIYATSNRRHLVKETWKDRADMEEDIHHSDTVQEKLSLSERFGIAINFSVPQQQEYFDIVCHLAKRQRLSLPEDGLINGARAWGMHHGSFSGRTAQQYINHLKGEQTHAEN